MPTECNLNYYKNIYEKIHLKNKIKQNSCTKRQSRFLSEELGLVGYEPKHTLTFETGRKDVEDVGRFDPEYFQPKYEEIIEKD